MTVYHFCFIISDGKLEVVVPSFVHYLEVLEGSDGDKLPGMWIGCVFQAVSWYTCLLYILLELASPTVS